MGRVFIKEILIEQNVIREAEKTNNPYKYRIKGNK